MLSRYFPLFCCSFAIFLGLVLTTADSAPKPHTAKRSSIPSKPTVDELAIELAKKHLIRLIFEEEVNSRKAKESVKAFQQDKCSHIKSVGAPITHNSGQFIQGAWMKDPLRIMGDETIFVLEFYLQKKVVQEFENMEKFKAGVLHKTHTLPYNYLGTGAVVYGPYLYYNRENSPYVIKYDLRSDKTVAQITLPGFTPRKNGYQWCGVYTCAVDLAVDEQGLWALWGDADNSFRLYAQMIDVYQNVVTHTWALATERMDRMGNAFVACGVIYTIDQYNGRSTTINFAYDTKTSKQWNPNIQFTNQYGYNSMVAYNPTEKVLYAWDNKRQVTYSLTFQ